MRVGQDVIWVHRVRNNSNTVGTERLRVRILKQTKYRATVRVPPQGEPSRVVSVPLENLEAEVN